MATVMRRHFGRGADAWLTSLFTEVQRAYAGRHPDFQAGTLPFHNFTHACETAIATLRLLDGHLRRNAPPALTARHCELVVAAVLMHDIGFLQETGDTKGTGAKYTPTHVARSERFAARLLAGRGLRNGELRFVQLAIRGTGLNTDARRLPFRNGRERFLSSAVAAGDLIGQMAAPDYPQRLVALHDEWVAAARQNRTPTPPSLRQIRLRTATFYREHLQRRLETDWHWVADALIWHFPHGRDRYAASIRANLRRIHRQARRSC